MNDKHKCKTNILRPIKASSKSKKAFNAFAVIDIEVESWVNYLVGGFYDGGSKTYFTYDNLTEGVDRIYNYCAANNITDIFAHFGGKFDFQFFIQEFAFSKEWELGAIIPRGSGILGFSVVRKGEKAKYVTKKGKNGKSYQAQFQLKFTDSAALLPFSLRKLCKAFKVEVQKGHTDFVFIGDAYRNEDYSQKIAGASYSNGKEFLPKFELRYNGKVVKKLPKNYDKSKVTYFDLEENDGYEHRIYTKEDVLSYLESDNVGLWQVIDTFYKWPLIQKAGQALTTASQAVKIWRTFLDKPIHSVPKKVDEFVRKAYFGGRTEIFKLVYDRTGDILKNLPPQWKDDKVIFDELVRQSKTKGLSCFDVNSLYPTVMLNFDYPTKYESTVFGLENYDASKIAFWEATVIVPEDMWCPPLGVNYAVKSKDGKIEETKLIFPTGRFNGYWSTYELEYAKSLGVKVVSIGRGDIFNNGGKIFESYIDYLYKLRLEAQATGDMVNNILSKLMMNSTYGKLGMKLERTQLVFDNGESGLKLHSQIADPRTGNVYRLMEKETTLDSSFTNVAIPAMVTSYSRVWMHKHYLKFGREHLYYTDTDSCFVDDASKIQTGKELGMMKLEYTADSSYFLLPKTYYLDGCIGPDFDEELNFKIAMKGFDKKKIKHFTIEDFQNQLIGEISSLNIRQEPKFATLKTALKKGFFVCMNFDPEFDKFVDTERQKTFDEIDLNMRNVLSPKEYKEWKKGRKTKFIKKDYKSSERAIHSKYSKRKLLHDGFFTEPININEAL